MTHPEPEPPDASEEDPSEQVGTTLSDTAEDPETSGGNAEVQVGIGEDS